MTQIMSKKWLFSSLAVAALALGACSDKGAATTEDDPTLDAQTQVEQEATGVDDAVQVNDDVAVATADDDVAVATADDSEVLDGSESEEHISTN